MKPRRPHARFTVVDAFLILFALVVVGAYLYAFVYTL